MPMLHESTSATDSRCKGASGLVTVGLLWILGPVWYLLCEAIAAAGFPGYSYATFYISDLGVSTVGGFQGRFLNSQIPAVMNAGFIGSGLLFLLGIVILVPRLPRRPATVWFALLGLIHSIGIVFVGLVPGSPENAAKGLIVIHVAGAVAAIGGGNLTAIVSARAFRALSLPMWHRRVGGALGTLGWCSAVLLTVHLWLPDGVWERGAVYPFFLWQLLSGVVLVGKGRGSEQQHRAEPDYSQDRDPAALSLRSDPVGGREPKR